MPTLNCSRYRYVSHIEESFPPYHTTHTDRESEYGKHSIFRYSFQFPLIHIDIVFASAPQRIKVQSTTSVCNELTCRQSEQGTHSENTIEVGCKRRITTHANAGTYKAKVYLRIAQKTQHPRHNHVLILSIDLAMFSIQIYPGKIGKLYKIQCTTVSSPP